MCAATKISDWEKILADAARCEECSDRICMKVCPNKIDIHAALSHLLRIKPGIWWVEDMQNAINYADDAIEECFA
jgi:CO dehydrogenase/acetyl-CoA synthase alpha subunit